MSGSLGLDIGGANLKAAETAGRAHTIPFALWKQPRQLTEQLRQLRHLYPGVRACWVAMTGELCDCYASKREGVEQILHSVRGAFGDCPVGVWSTSGEFFTPDVAAQRPLEVAAANWHALATWVGQSLAPRGEALLIDIGSTTSDLIPLHRGRVASVARTDHERLLSRELVYTGVSRTPLCALMGPRAMAEWFATTQDVHLLLGHLPEDPQDCDTADGRPRLISHAHARLARMVGLDAEGMSLAQATQLASEVHAGQLQRLREALEEICDRRNARPETLILSGSGEFLARQAVEPWLEAQRPPRVISLGQSWGEACASAAPAYALACLGDRWDR